jgi:hypothetical protein
MKAKETFMNKFKELFKVDSPSGVSIFRLCLLRIFYAMAVLLLGIDVWTEIFTHGEEWESLPAVAFSFWGAFSVLAILGVIHPLKMLPLLLLQFSYKLIWLIMVAYPLWSIGRLAESAAQGLAKANFIGLILDLAIIPWAYILKNHVWIRND